MPDTQSPPPPHDWLSVFGVHATETYPPGEILFRQGVVNRDVYLVLNGYVNLICRGDDDGLDRPVCWRSPGQLVGDCSAFANVPSPVTARTATHCEVRRLSVSRFLKALEQDDHPVLKQIVADRSRQVLSALRSLSETAATQARQRLEHVLSLLLVQQHGNRSDQERQLSDFSPNSRELAGYIGVNVTYLPELFASLERDGLVRRARGTLVVCRPAKLLRPVDAVNTAHDSISRWRAVLNLGTPRKFRSGYTLFERDSPPDDVYLIESGYVGLSAVVITVGGFSERSVAWGAPGQLLGDPNAVVSSRHPGTAVTRTECLLHHIEASKFLSQLSADHSHTLYQLLIDQSRDLLSLNRQLTHLKTLPLKNRLADVLLQLAKEQITGHSCYGYRLVQYSPNNATLAGYIGTEERYVSNLMQDLKARKIAWRGAGRVISIADPKMLLRDNSGLLPVESAQSITIGGRAMSRSAY